MIRSVRNEILAACCGAPPSAKPGTAAENATAAVVTHMLTLLNGITFCTSVRRMECSIALRPSRWLFGICLPARETSGFSRLKISLEKRSRFGYRRVG